MSTTETVDYSVDLFANLANGPFHTFYPETV